MAEEDYAYAEEDPEDPDYIAQNPPEKVIDCMRYFQVGEHEGKWSEYDDRGVPVKNIKKKKLAKKEQQQVEAEYAAHKKKYDQYLQDVGTWEQAKVDAEAGLETTDPLRWAFRQLGEDKNEPIEVDSLGELFDLMGWTLGKGELKAVKQDSGKMAVDSYLDLETLRAYVNENLPKCILEVRLATKAVNTFDVDQVYSPRTWRLMAAEDGSPRDKKKKKSSEVASPRGGEKKSKKDKDDPASPRGSMRKERKSTAATKEDEASPRSKVKKEKSEKADDGSPRSKKDKKEKKK